MKIPCSLILLVILFLSSCTNAPSSILEKAIAPTPTQIQVGSVTPLPTYPQTKQKTVTPTVTITVTQKADLRVSQSPTPTLLPNTPEPTLQPPSLSNLQVINRSNVNRIVPIWRFEPQDNRPESQGGEFSFSPDGKTLALSVDNRVELLNIQTGKIAKIYSLDNLIPQWAEQKVYSLSFSPGGKRLAGLTEVGVILWDLSSEKPLWITKKETDSNEAFTKMVFSPGGDVIVTTSIAYGSDIRVWSSETGEPLKALHMPNQLDAVFSLDGTRLYTVDRIEGFVRAWDPRSWEEVSFPKTAEAYVTLTISPNGKIVAANRGWNGDGEDVTSLYLLDGWKNLGSLMTFFNGFSYESNGPTRIEPSFNSDGGILALAIAKDQGELPNHIELWDTNAQKKMATLDENMPAPIVEVAFSPDGRLLVARSENGTAVFWGVPSK